MTMLDQYPGAMFDRMGDSPALSERLIGLIRSGRKTASCGAVRDYEAEGDPLPVPGQHVIVMDHHDNPALVYRVTDVTCCAFDEVSEDFARAEGEGDFAEWRSGHIAYFGRNGGWSPDLRLVCERFGMVEDLADAPTTTDKEEP